MRGTWKVNLLFAHCLYQSLLSLAGPDPEFRWLSSMCQRFPEILRITSTTTPSGGPTLYQLHYFGPADKNFAFQVHAMPVKGKTLIWLFQSTLPHTP